MKKLKCSTLLAPALIAVVASSASAQTSDLDQLKATVQQLQRTIQEQNARIAELERAKGTTPPATAVTPAVPTAPADKDKSLAQITTEAPAGQAAHVPYRQTLKDEQEAAPRAGDLIMDPKYQGYMHVPNTPVIIRFNAKPRVDFTYDLQNAGNDDRFVTAHIPVDGDPFKGGDGVFNINAKGSQLRLDVRAPELGGDFRFYYQNDFFGSGSDTGDMKYRIQHIYGQFYGFKAGFTYGVWEDPDSWPDTVDYEGPNAVIFSRLPWPNTYAWNDSWNSTFGVEKPDIFVDTDSGPNPGGNMLTRIPDLGFNTRFEKADFGHLQFSTMFRDLGARDSLGDEHHVFGWGVNLSAGLDLTKKDSLQLLGVYGEGVGGLGNDSGFFNSDAAFNSNGDLEALPYWSVMAGMTHRWTDTLRSTITYGYVNLDNTSAQAGDFYHTTHYASANIVWQLRRRLSIGFEGLYGLKEANNGVESGDHWRLQLGMVYSLFD